MAMLIKAITFDFWSTLYHYTQSPRSRREQHLRSILAAAGCDDVTAEQVTQAMKEAWDVWDRIWRKEQRTADAAEWLRLFLDNVGAIFPEATFAQAVQGIEEAVVDMALPVDGVTDVLPRLASRYKLGIISDTGIAPGRVLRSLLERDSLLSCFSQFTFSDEIGRSKPHPDVFLATLAGLGVAPEQAVHVGDLRHTDIAGARAVGMLAIRYAAIRDDLTPQYPEAHAIVRTYTELESWIEKWGRDI